MHKEVAHERRCAWNDGWNGDIQWNVSRWNDENEVTSPTDTAVDCARYDEAMMHLDHDRDLVRRQNDEDRHSFTRDAAPDVTRSRQVEQTDGRLGSAFSSVSK